MTSATQTARSLVLTLALAQFIASYAGTNMNVAISTIASDLGCSVAGIQGAITLFTLTVAALMIPPIYILITVAFTQVDTRAKYFGVVSGAAGLGAAQRMAQRRPQAILVRGGFVLTALGIALLIALGRAHNSVWAFVPGLLITGIGIGVMLTASVNVVLLHTRMRRRDEPNRLVSA